MDDIRLNFTYDLTGYVTISKHPFALGGYGNIYRGKFTINTGNSIDVAIKVYKMYLQHDQRLDDKMKRFRKEISVWLKLHHENVLQLFGTIRDPNIQPDIPAMVCPWIENGALSGYLERNKDLTVTKRLILIDGVARGLQYLHFLCIIHGDLSGSNVLVNADGRACIADFGLSVLLTTVGGSPFASSRQNKGTVRWMAPELLDPQSSHTPDPTTRSDVYSFGSVMLQTLTGNIPYCHLPRDEQVMYAILKGERPADRPPQEVLTNGRWKFIERCWSVSGSRPSSDEIVKFTTTELTTAESAVVSSVPPDAPTVSRQYATQLPSVDENGPIRSPTPRKCTAHLPTFSTGVHDGDVPPGNGPSVEPGVSNNGRRSQTINVIIFGETGVGKSAVVNLIAQRTIARVSPDANSCTMSATPYDVSFDGIRFRIFDTAGLNEPDIPVRSHQDAIAKAYDLILGLRRVGGIHLLLFCMRAEHITLTTRNNYQLFVEFFCQRRVPVGVVVTNCERENDMEDWWTRMEAAIESRYGIRSDGHACVVAVSNGIPGEEAKYRASQQRVRELLKRCFLKTGAFLPDETDWLAMAGRGLRRLVRRGETPKRKDIERALKRLGLPPQSVKQVVDMIEKGGTSSGAY